MAYCQIGKLVTISKHLSTIYHQAFYICALFQSSFVQQNEILRSSSSFSSTFETTNTGQNKTAAIVFLERRYPLKRPQMSNIFEIRYQTFQSETTAAVMLRRTMPGQKKDSLCDTHVFSCTGFCWKGCASILYAVIGFRSIVHINGSLENILVDLVVFGFDYSETPVFYVFTFTNRPNAGNKLPKIKDDMLCAL